MNSRYITSTVGGRASPGGIGSTNHKGTDIGRVGYTSSIYAAKSGTVIVSQYSSSYGNYVVISTAAAIPHCMPTCPAGRCLWASM
ncbi:MAG: M23 family metallopeptidase [Dysosmobacter welbionis]